MNVDNDPQELWKSHIDALPPSPDAVGICELARRRERESIWGRRIGLLALAGFAVAFAHNVWQVDQPWVRLGQGWMLAVVTAYLWSLIRHRTHRRASNEACAGFLLRSLEMKRNGYLAFRRIVLLLIPAIAASWWGGGPALRARAMGLDPSSPYYRYWASIWPMIATCSLLLVVWFVFSGTAKRVSAEFEALRLRIGAE